MRFKFLGAVFGFGLATAAAVAARYTRRAVELPAERTTDSVARALGPTVQARLAPALAKAGLPWPVPHLLFVGLKQERQLEIWGSIDEKHWKLLKTYPVLAASGKPGPKLREGDEQVPEGVYSIEAFNPRSRFYLSLRVNYPNAQDRSLAKEEGRTHPGSDIYIHGKSVSVGCLAIGDDGIEEVFTLAAKSSRQIPVWIVPRDFRKQSPGDADWTTHPEWVRTRYTELEARLKSLSVSAAK